MQNILTDQNHNSEYNKMQQQICKHNKIQQFQKTWQQIGEHDGNSET